MVNERVDNAKTIVCRNTNRVIVRDSVGPSEDRCGATGLTVWLITCAMRRCKLTCEYVEIVMRLRRVRCGTHATARAQFARGWWSGGWTRCARCAAAAPSPWGCDTASSDGRPRARARAWSADKGASLAYRVRPLPDRNLLKRISILDFPERN